MGSIVFTAGSRPHRVFGHCGFVLTEKSMNGGSQRETDLHKNTAIEKTMIELYANCLFLR